MKNKFQFQKCLILFIIFFCMFSFSGCGGPTQPQQPATDMVILVGNHSNSEKIISPIDSAVEKVYSSFGNIAIIAIDGSPEIVKSTSGNIIGFYDAEQNKKSRDTNNDNPEWWERHILGPRKREVVTKVDELSADSPEVDLITSWFETLKAFNTIKSSDESIKEIVIIDTGLSTTGPLSFLDNNLLILFQQNKKLTPGDVEQLINDLDTNASLPDLSGIAVTWYGLGSVCSPQPELTAIAKYNLKVIWGEILKATGALKSPYQNADSEYGVFIDTLTDGPIICDYKVTPVDPIIEEPEIKESDNSSQSNDIEPGESSSDPEPPESVSPSASPIPLLSEQLGFEPNSSEYVDDEQAKKILMPYAELLMASPNVKILLVGTTSDPERNGGDLVLSQERAESVKCSLGELGVPKDRILVRGIGSNRYISELYNANEWQGDKYVESEAKKKQICIYCVN